MRYHFYVLDFDLERTDTKRIYIMLLQAALNISSINHLRRSVNNYVAEDFI